MISEIELKQIVAGVTASVTAALDCRMPVPDRPVLNWEEAVRYVGKQSLKGFKSWCRRWKVKPCAHGRYNRNQLEDAMKRESRAVYVHGKGST
jgi:hypothetical protein